MTRFARAKGSKASNERLPNDATPWHVMKQQLVENLAKKQEPLERTRSAKELLENVDKVNDPTKAKKSWVEFPDEAKESKKGGLNKSWAEFPNDRKKSKKKGLSEVQGRRCEEGFMDRSEGSTEFKNRNMNESGDSMPGKKQKIDKNKGQVESAENQTRQNGTRGNAKFKKRSVNETGDFASGKSKKQKVDKSESAENRTEENSWKRAKENKRRNPQATRNDENFKRRFNKDFTNGFRNNHNARKFDDQKKKVKPAKIRDDKVHKRRKPDSGSSRMMINGVEVEIVKFDGFPVKKEDAERLGDLKQKMIMKGIPQKEIDAAMKLERRKAEKALARIKKCVCFHCRKAGHNLSDCPELGKEQAATGICFKCGSTEHAHFECRVSKPGEFRYATCFICREQGHIAKQCPDNPRGVYPQGGACKVCGDVTHLKKDCPDLIREREEAAVTVNTIADGDLESLGDGSQSVREEVKRPKRVVKF